MKAILVTAFLLASVPCHSQSPVHQLRIYEIFKDNKEAFHTRFKDQASRIMKQYDFEIIAIWETEKADRIEFVYLLEWENEQALQEQWAKFMADQEWAEIKKKTSAVHGKLVGEIEDRLLVLTDYSPSKSLLPKQY